MTDVAISSVLRQAEALAHDVDRRTQQFVRIVEELMARVPGFLSGAVEPLRSTMAQLVALQARFRTYVTDLLSQAGNPARVGDVADAWATAVADPLTRLADAIAPTKLEGDKRWHGYAAELYEAMADEQRSGVTGVRDLAVQVRTTLESVSHALVVFWVAFCFALVELLAVIVAAIAAASTGVGAPAGAAAIVAGLAHATAFLGATVGALTAAMLAIEHEQGAIRQKLADLGSGWPRPDVARIADASDADGDRSDWTPYR